MFFCWNDSSHKHTNRISAPGHGKEVVDGLNYVDKRYIYQLMYKVKLPGSIIFDSQIKIHTGTEKKYVV